MRGSIHSTIRSDINWWLTSSLLGHWKVLVPATGSWNINLNYEWYNILTYYNLSSQNIENLSFVYLVSTNVTYQIKQINKSRTLSILFEKYVFKKIHRYRFHNPKMNSFWQQFLTCFEHWLRQCQQLVGKYDMTAAWYLSKLLICKMKLRIFAC